MCDLIVSVSDHCLTFYFDSRHGGKKKKKKKKKRKKDIFEFCLIIHNQLTIFPII